MKYLVCLFLFVSTFAQAQEKELAAIATTLNYYLDGGTNNDFETLKKAFHTDATMKFINGKGEYNTVNAIKFFKKGMKPGPKQNRQTRITSIDVNGHAASARIEIDYPTFRFIDYMSLLKIKGEWKIVNKIFYRESRNVED